MSVRSEHQAVIGFFEDIPSLIIIIIGICVFIASVANTYVTFTARQSTVEPADDCWEFLQCFRAWHGLVKEGYIEGVFDTQKAEVLTVDRIMSEFPVNFDYKIEIIDISDYPNADDYCYLYSTSEIPSPEEARAGIHVEEAPVVLWVGSNELHPARLVVTIWS
jgi:hypothetical protein